MKKPFALALILALPLALLIHPLMAADPVPVPNTPVPVNPAPINPAPSANSDVNSSFPAQGFSALAERLLPAVVNISTTQTIKDKGGQGGDEDGMGGGEMPQFPPGSPFEDFFKDFMEKQPGGKGMQEMPRQRKTTSLGSGFIIDPTGYIVTNNHVIQDADEINVILHDGTNLKATLVGRDSKTDVALLKVTSAKPLPYVPFGDSDKMKVGDWILVIGNPFGLGGTVTQGIISARARDINSGPYDDYIQTDASINRGNSGGPMFNLSGEVIGISTAIFSPSGGSVGIGFAVPSAMAHNVVDQLKVSGKIKRGWLGVRIQNVTEEIATSLKLDHVTGALVSSLTPDSPAAKAGVKPGDVIISFDNKSVTEMRRLPRMVAEAGINRSVPLNVWRDGKEVPLKVMIGEMKEEEDMADDGADTTKPEKAEPAAKTTEVPELDAKFAVITPEARRTFELNDNAKGILVIALGDDSPLIDKGLRPGDLVVEADQKELKDPKDLAQIAKDKSASKKPILLLIDRQGDLRFVGVTPIEAKAKKEPPKKDDKKEEKKK